MNSYVLLGIAALLPAIAAMILYKLNERPSIAQANPMTKQIIIGVVFGIFAILGTEWGIDMNGAQVNCRDAAPLIAGLMFGGPAGIIAGIIGGVERYVAVFWGVGAYTQIACSVSTVLAGFYAAALRKWMFDNKRPGWLIAFAIGIVMEVFHLTMVFLTNMDTPIKAMSVVQACTLPMTVYNGASVLIAAVGITFLNKHKFTFRTEHTRIAQTIQKHLLITVILAFAITSAFVYTLQNNMAESQADSALKQATTDVTTDIRQASDSDLLAKARLVNNELGSASLKEIAKRLDIAEINVINKWGIITDSTYKKFIGYDMNSGDQSREFMVLLKNQDSLAQKYGPTASDPKIQRKYAGIRTKDGILQVGYDAKQFQDDIQQQLKDIAPVHHVGNTGFVIITDQNNKIVSAPSKFKVGSTVTKDQMANRPKENTTFQLNIEGEDYLCQYVTAEGYYILAAQPVAEAYQAKTNAMYANSFTQILVFALLFALIYLLIKTVVVNQIQNINRSLAKIASGNLNVEIDERSSEEFASLSDDINHTVDTLKRYIEEASARIDKELELAKNIQSSAVPTQFPAFPKRKDFDIYASMHTAKEVGGDFYDFYMLDDNTLNFLIADVSGKGIGAAMFMMRSKTELKNLSEAGHSIDEVFTMGNNALCEGNDADMFVTAWQGSMQLDSGQVAFANAGHNPPLVYRSETGKFEYLKARAGFVLAGMEGIPYKQQDLSLAPGDMLYLYTDGVTEATDANNELYGEDRLLALLNSREFTSSEEICTVVKEDVDKFVGEADQFDDITMVALRYLGIPQNPSIEFEHAKTEDVVALTEFVEARLEELEAPMKTIFQINIAIDEIFSNIVKFAYPGGDGPARIQVGFKEESRTVYIRFEDEGIPYNPLTLEDPDVTLSAEERKIGGLGVYMVKKSMDDMKYKYENDKNVLTIFKKI